METILASEFIETLKQNNLVIVDKNLLTDLVQQNQSKKQLKILQKEWISLRDIFLNQLFGKIAQNTVHAWIKSGKINNAKVRKVGNKYFVHVSEVMRIRESYFLT